MLACHVQAQRQGKIMPIIANRLKDLTDLLRSVAKRDG